MKSICIRILFLVSTLTAGGLEAATRVGYCAVLNDTLADRYVFSVSELDNKVLSLQVESVIVSKDGQELPLSDLYLFSLDEKTIKQNDAKGFSLDDGARKLKINRITGNGKYVYSSYDETCWPGESEWCLIKKPGYTVRKFKLADCSLNL